jgi:hypothetical protein
MRGRTHVVAILLLASYGLCGCWIGRRGRNLTRAVQAAFACEQYRYDRLEDDRYRVYACPDATGRYIRQATFHCSRRLCASLSESARLQHAAVFACVSAEVAVEETADTSVFRTSGCERSALMRCEMRDQVVSCNAVGPPGGAFVAPMLRTMSLLKTP